MSIPVDQQRVHAWLDKHWRNRACPVCEKASWSLNDSLVEFRDFAAGNVVVGGVVYPSLMVICSICGYCFFINAVRAGFVEVPPKAAVAYPSPFNPTPPGSIVALPPGAAPNFPPNLLQPPGQFR